MFLRILKSLFYWNEDLWWQSPFVDNFFVKLALFNGTMKCSARHVELSKSRTKPLEEEYCKEFWWDIAALGDSKSAVLKHHNTKVSWFFLLLLNIYIYNSLRHLLTVPEVFHIVVPYFISLKPAILDAIVDFLTVSTAEKEACYG